MLDKYKVWYKKFWDRSEAETQEWAFVKEIEAKSLEDVFHRMQGENWSPNGEARNLLSSLGIQHTSMSVGDFIENRYGQFYRVEPYSFELYNKLPCERVR